MNENDKTKKNAEPGHDPVSGIVSEYRTEYRRIVWPSREILFKHTVTVIAVALMFGAYIALLDGAFGFGIQQLIQLVI